jgi:hypothetical protein
MLKWGLLWLGVLSVLLGLFSFGSGAVQAQSEQTWGLVTTDVADVRAGPDFAYPILMTLPRDTSVEIVGRSGNFFRAWDGRQWVQIRVGAGYGWIFARLLRTSQPFNALRVTGIGLPRDRDGRVPEVFDLSTFICDQWVGEYGRSGDFLAGDQAITVTFPPMNGAVNYSVVFRDSRGFTLTFDTPTPSLTVELARLSRYSGVLTWSVIPYWNDSVRASRAQQLCLARVGGTLTLPPR